MFDLQGGKFFFMEHVRAKEGTVMYYIQPPASIPFHYFARCDVMNKCYENIKAAAGFEKVELDMFEADELVHPTAIIFFVWLLKRHVSGVATK